MNFSNMSNDEVRVIQRREARHSNELNHVRILLSHRCGVDKADPLLEALKQLEGENARQSQEAYAELERRGVNR